jgi:hypothetical protein
MKTRYSVSFGIVIRALNLLIYNNLLQYEKKSVKLYKYYCFIVKGRIKLLLLLSL